MIWNLPLTIRIIIIFVGLPLLDRLYKLLYGKYFIPSRIKYYLEYQPRFFYLFGWFLLVKSIILTTSSYLIDYWNNYQVVTITSNSNDVGIWMLYSLGFFLIGYLLSRLHIKYRYRAGRLTQYLSYVGFIFGSIMILYQTYFLLNRNGFEYLKNDIVWHLLTGISIIYRYLIELVLRSLDN